ncbi:unnamed protein product [Symbiodinium pilosum]|uniref:FAD-binding PCMH-type domain-containing protein n=1 Tax=Symbiodinium pilosum TaxID=2952 RepID=A0A812TLJ4_SYMPI|nr:unnamed protein product [Symbiodinium pilosum]
MAHLTPYIPCIHFRADCKMQSLQGRFVGVLMSLGACVYAKGDLDTTCSESRVSARGNALMQLDRYGRTVFGPHEERVAVASFITPEDAFALKRRLSQNATVFHADDVPALEEANAQLLLQPLVKQVPSMIVHVATADDLLEVLRFCFPRRLRPVIVATGHDWNGRSSGAGAVRIATPKLCWVHAEGDSARVGAGCTWGHIWKELEPLGHIGVGGALGTVSIGGSLQGGGHGGLSRQHGLIADQLLAAKVALANGSGVVLADADGPHADLFRALRGGGGGTYGAVVEFTIRIHPFPKNYSVSIVSVPVRSNDNKPDARAMTKRFFHNASGWAQVPDSWAGWHEVNSDHDGEKWSGSLAAWLFHWGQRPEEACLSHGCPVAMSEYFNFVGQWPVEGNLHMQIQSYMPTRIKPSMLKNSFLSNSFVSLADLEDEEKAGNLTDLVIDSALKALDRKEVIHWTYNDVLGGQVPTHGQDTVISPGFRTAIFEVCVGKEWKESDNDQQISQVVPIVDRLYGLGLGSGMSYYNEVTRWRGLHDVDDWKYRFWGKDTYNFLHRVKRTYDPCNILWVDRGVGCWILVICKTCLDMHTEQTIAELKEELHESALLGVEEKRASATSSEGGIPGGLRKKAMAAQFDEDLDEFMRENAQLKDQVSRAERSKRELEEKLRELEMAKPIPLASPPAGQAKVGLQVQHKAREINWEKVREELKQEVEAEKLQVAALKEDIRKFRKQASKSEERIYHELQEEKASRIGELQEAQRNHEKEMKRLRKDLEAARFQLLATNFRASPSLAPPSPGGERLNSILSARSDDEPSPFDFDTGTGDASLADELAGHFQWPLDQEALHFRLPEEVNELRIELRQMQTLQEGSAEVEAALFAANERLTAQAQEMHILHREYEGFQEESARRTQDSAMPVEAAAAPESLPIIDDRRLVEEMQSDVRKHKQDEMSSLHEAVNEKEAELEELQRQMLPYGGTKQILQSVKELSVVKAELEFIKKEANDAQQWKAEVSELKSLHMGQESSVRSRDDLTREFSELQMQTAALRERHATMLCEQAELSRTQSQMAAAVNQAKPAPKQDGFSSMPKAQHRFGREEADVLKTLAALRFVDAHLYP